MSMIHEITGGLATKRSKRKGRGESSGKGKTCGRGNKGSKARVGRPWWKPGHEGGQTPLHRRLPKRGFSNDPFVNPFYVVNLGEFEQFEAGSVVDAAIIAAAKLIPDTKVPVKVLGDGTFTKKLTIKAGWYSKPALARLLELGCEALNEKGEKFEHPKPKKKFVKRVAAPKAEAPKAEAKAADAAEQK
jgi:large subunit ribosomal protein L15